MLVNRLTIDSSENLKPWGYEMICNCIERIGGGDFMGKCPVCLQNSLHETTEHSDAWCENCGTIGKCPDCHNGFITIKVDSIERDLPCCRCEGSGYIAEW
jgi:hypothetical protein